MSMTLAQASAIIRGTRRREQWRFVRGGRQFLIWERTDLASGSGKPIRRYIERDLFWRPAPRITRM